MNRKLWLALAVGLALIASMLVTLGAFANPPAPGTTTGSQGIDVPANKIHAGKNVDQPNPIDKARLDERQRLLEAGQTAQANTLAKTGTDRALVILVDFGGTDTFTWTAGASMWDPINKADPREYTGTAGDCSQIITETKSFTYSGPVHGQIPRPISAVDASGDSIWTDNPSTEWYQSFLFGDGVVFDYDRQDGSHVHQDFTGKSVRDFYSDMSTGQYTLTGDVYGWLSVPHSEMYYGNDECPGARSGVPAGWSNNGGNIEGAGSARSLVYDALMALNAISDTIPGFNWANYDTNGDGIIDRLWIIHAGYGEEDDTVLMNRTDYSEGAMWSHSSSGTLIPLAPGIAAGPYIMMPENGGIGVFAHESGHNIGAPDLYSYAGGETSAGFWTTMADDWTGYPLGYEPPAMDPYNLDYWGWLNPLVITDTTKTYNVTIGQTSRFPGGDGMYRGVKIELPTGEAPLPVQPWSGSHYWWGGKGDQMNSKMTLKSPIAIPNDGATLSFETAYGIENEWDFLWVQASDDGGTTWKTLTNANTVCKHDVGWIGGLNGFPEDLCGANIGGLTDYNANFPEPNTETFDLEALAGKNVLLRFWYMTDWATSFEGPFIDNVKVDCPSGNLFTDDAEGAAKWDFAQQFQANTGQQAFSQNYYLQYRNTSATGGYDEALGDPNYRYGPVNSGLLVWYNNNFYQDNELPNYLADYPSFGAHGQMLVVDAHPEPYRDPYWVGQGFNNEGGNVTSRSQMRDAPFSLNDTVPFNMVLATNPDGSPARVESFPGRPAVSTFNDALGYYPGAEYVNRGPGYPASDRQWVTKQWDASVVLPGTAEYSLKAPGLKATDPFRFWCSKITSGANTGKLSCYWYPGGIGTAGGTGNPGDTGAQYGWHMQIVAQTPTTTTVKIWNARNHIDVDATPDKTTAHPGDVVKYTVDEYNNGAADSYLVCMPIDTARFDYVGGSASTGGIELASCPSAPADLSQAQAAANPGAIVWIIDQGTAQGTTFSFSLKSRALTGVYQQQAAVIGSAGPVNVDLTTQPVRQTGSSLLFFPVTTR